MSFISNLFGGGQKPIQYTPQGFSNPTGFSVSGGGNVTQSPFLSQNLGAVSNTFAQKGNTLTDLYKTVAPGFSTFRQAGLSDISNKFGAQMSNLKDTLAQRRILGSSFANADISRQAADEEQARTDFIAKSYIAELDASNKLIQQAYDSYVQQYSTFINQSNIEAGTAAQLTASNNNTAAQIAIANAKLQAQAASGAGSLFGTVLGMGTGGGNTIGGSIFSGAGSLLSGLSPFASAADAGLGGAAAIGTGGFNFMDAAALLPALAV